jgi:hypothetical protein
LIYLVSVHGRRRRLDDDVDAHLAAVGGAGLGCYIERIVDQSWIEHLRRFVRVNNNALTLFNPTPIT